jgi:cytochrome P450
MELLPFGDPAYIEKPCAVWQCLRDEAPVYWSERHRFWAVAHYDDVVAVLHDPARFSSRGGPSGRSEQAGLPRHPLIQRDPPHHERLPRILSRAFTPRTTALRGQRIPRGDVLMLMFASANRNPRHVDRPAAFEPGRRPNDPVAFGQGIHFCPGPHLARLEARVGLEALGALLPELRLEPDRGRRVPKGILPGRLRLPVVGASA